MTIQRLFFTSQIKASDDPASPLLRCLDLISQDTNRSDSLTGSAHTYTQLIKDSAQIAVEVLSGSVSVNGISYSGIPHPKCESQDVALIRLPPEKRIYIDKLRAKPTLLYVSNGRLELSGIPLREKQLAWITNIEQVVITALSTCTRTVLIKHG